MSCKIMRRFSGQFVAMSPTIAEIATSLSDCLSETALQPIPFLSG